MLYDTKVMNEMGCWVTDLTCGSKTRSQDRARFLMPRVPAVIVEDQRGRRVTL